MKTLFIGGTGILSTACTRLAAERGIDLWLLNRGQRRVELPHGVRVLQGDVRDPASVQLALADHNWDVVVNWINFSPADIERDLALFAGKCGQYVFISSASVYQKPPTHYLITESTPLSNPYWDYSQKKIACEERLVQAYRYSGFPITIVRPSLTYGETLIFLALNSWAKSWTVPARMLAGKPVLVPGDGTSLWTSTHNTDFAKGLVGLLGNRQALGHAFHVTSDEALTWNQHYETVAHALGVEPNLVHIPSDWLIAHDPSQSGPLLGDKIHSMVFDNTKIKRFVPDYVATTTFAQGVAQSVDWFRADPARQQIDEAFDQWTEGVLEAYGWE